MFKFKGFINSGATAPTIQRVMVDEDNSYLEKIAPGVALTSESNGAIVPCSKSDRPLYICLDLHRETDGSYCMLYYSVTDDMILEAPLVIDSEYDDIIHIVPTVFIDEINGSSGVRMSTSETHRTGVIAEHPHITDYSKTYTVLVRFPGNL